MREQFKRVEAYGRKHDLQARRTCSGCGEPLREVRGLNSCDTESCPGNLAAPADHDTAPGHAAEVVRSPDCPVDRNKCEGPGTYYCDAEIWGSVCRRYFERMDAGDLTPAERLAQEFHETYERLAPSFAYSTRKDSAVPWEKVPMRNRRLMVAVAEHLLAASTTAPGTEASDALGEAVKDVLWRAVQYGETSDGDTAYYLVTKGAMHRLMGAAVSVVPGAAFRVSQDTLPDDELPASNTAVIAAKALRDAADDYLTGHYYDGFRRWLRARADALDPRIVRDQGQGEGGGGS